ncbi:MAG: DUF4351 domain-containing protein [Candidatus Poribacteria bacterium]|nr:DUF4351 domain-containing protein [Candidatus Poribacteria bacterium]
MAEAIAGTLLEQGIEQGETRAKRNAILKLLQSRFSNVPETLTTRINAIHSHAQLDKLFDEILAAETLDDIHL